MVVVVVVVVGGGVGGGGGFGSTQQPPNPPEHCHSVFAQVRLAQGLGGQICGTQMQGEVT